MPLKPAAQRIQDLLTARGHSGAAVREMPNSTRTAEDAAAACGCTVAQIAKSMVFRIAGTDSPVLVVASGPNRVDETAVSDLLSEDAEAPVRIDRAEPAFVRAATGFAIGGVPPIGHATAPVTLIDEDLLAHAEIWCAAGTPNAVFPIAPRDLVTLTGGRIARIARG